MLRRIMGVCLGMSLLGSYCQSQDVLKLAKDSGCLKCHGVDKPIVGPALSSIANRYNANTKDYDLTLMTVADVKDLPEKRKSSVIVAQVANGLHVRVFDSEGRRIADRSEANMNSDDSLSQFKTQFTSDLVASSKELVFDDRQSIAKRAMKVAGLTPKDSRDRLIQTVKHGGKGNWTDISKHVPMPSFSERLTDQQIGELVDWILLNASQTTPRILKLGLGTGVVTPTSDGTTVTLTASADPGSVFVRWEQGPSEETTTDTSNPITLTMAEGLTVRAVFDLTTTIPELTDFTPEGIQTYLTNNPVVNTPARFLKALPKAFKESWILMSRSESLQTGTATSPRILLQSEDAQQVFTIGMSLSSSYPGSHPNAIEYMQWDGTQKNFRFHEIVLDSVPQMGVVLPRSRGVAFDDKKCSKCHSTRNVLNSSAFPGTSGVTPGTVQVKMKPNWDPYDSWAGMLPFNRDRIYQGSLEAAAFRSIMNLGNWQSNDNVRMVLEQLRLQPEGVPEYDKITRRADGTIKIAFDPPDPFQLEPEPIPSLATISTNYSFDAKPGTGTPTPVVRNQSYVTLHHSTSPTSEEGRGVQLFDFLGGADGRFNQTRIADEVANHRYATGSVPIDVRPIALAIARDWIRYDEATQTIVSDASLTVDRSFFDSRNGMTIKDLVKDTSDRARTIPRRKADLQRFNLDRITDFYQDLASPEPGLIAKYGDKTTTGIDANLGRIRQEIFRRPTSEEGFPVDTSEMDGIYVDRESYDFNTNTVALFRYFLEPLGVSVDKWSMGVRGRSRSYAFADVFSSYKSQMIVELKASLQANPISGLVDLNDPVQIIQAVNQTLATLPQAQGIPKYTDIQRIFNKGCIECHGGLNYPPYSNRGTFVDLSEDETPPVGSDRLRRAYDIASIFVSTDLTNSRLYELIVRDDEECLISTDFFEKGMMPCGGPKLSKSDIETVRRWIIGGTPYSFGDPHIRTVDGHSYDFQAAGEFVYLRDEYMELQVRQVAVSTKVPVGPNEHTGLTSCVSVNGAIALRIGKQRITYEPNLNGAPDPAGLQLRVNGELVQALPDQGLNLPGRVAINRTSIPGGIQIEASGGTTFVITPIWWDHYKLWYLNIDTRNVRATDGIMGAIVSPNWLPALPNGDWLGSMPEGLQERYDMLYGQFANSWRVSDSNSLFDYAPGTSTKTFTIENWPNGIHSENCEAPQVPGGPVLAAPQDPMADGQAAEICNSIESQELRQLAMIDVLATGDAGFARAYKQLDMQRKQQLPPIPVSGVPVDSIRLVDPVATLAWTRPLDVVTTGLSYKLYVWPIDQEPEEKYATRITETELKKDLQLVEKRTQELMLGKSYYWKVIVQDRNGGRSHSKIHRFEVKKN